MLSKSLVTSQASEWSHASSSCFCLRSSFREAGCPTLSQGLVCLTSPGRGHRGCKACFWILSEKQNTHRHTNLCCGDLSGILLVVPQKRETLSDPSSDLTTSPNPRNCERSSKHKVTRLRDTLHLAIALSMGDAHGRASTWHARATLDCERVAKTFLSCQTPTASSLPGDESQTSSVCVCRAVFLLGHSWTNELLSWCGMSDHKRP